MQPRQESCNFSVLALVYDDSAFLLSVWFSKENHVHLKIYRSTENSFSWFWMARRCGESPTQSVCHNMVSSNGILRPLILWRIYHENTVYCELGALQRKNYHIISEGSDFCEDSSKQEICHFMYNGSSTWNHLAHMWGTYFICFMQICGNT